MLEENYFLEKSILSEYGSGSRSIKLLNCEYGFLTDPDPQHWFQIFWTRTDSKCTFSEISANFPGILIFACCSYKEVLL